MEPDADIRDFLARHFSRENEVALSGPLRRERDISRQAATALLSRLVKKRVLAFGRGQRPRTYLLAPLVQLDKLLPLAGLEEHVVWGQEVKPLLAPHVVAEAMNMWEYGITEMVNNAIDHSQGTTLRLQLTINAAYSSCYITDDGEGVFHRITRLCNLPDERQAILELAKGKLTTDPSNHSGEGIFFSSRAFDSFSIFSGGLAFDHMHDEPDLLFEHGHDDLDIQGTSVYLRHGNACSRRLRDVFDQFAEPDEYTFSKTVVPVRLARMGAEGLVSRSQAQRLLRRIDRFKTVILDFGGVDDVGQAFADEIFRVFQRNHPDVKLMSENTNGQILSMISRAQAYLAQEGR